MQNDAECTRSNVQAADGGASARLHLSGQEHAAVAVLLFVRLLRFGALLRGVRRDSTGLVP